jgi:hypothetical protein
VGWTILKWILERWDSMDWIDLAHYRDQCNALVNTVMNRRDPQNAGKFLNSCTSGSFSRRAQLHEWVSEWVSETCNLPIV